MVCFQLQSFEELFLRSVFLHYFLKLQALRIHVIQRSQFHLRDGWREICGLMEASVA